MKLSKISTVNSRRGQRRRDRYERYDATAVLRRGQLRLQTPTANKDRRSRSTIGGNTRTLPEEQSYLRAFAK